MSFVADVAPRFDYARANHEVALTPHGALFRSPELELSLSTRCSLEIVDDADVRAHVDLRAGETATFVLDRVESGEMPRPYSDAEIAAQFDATVAFWQRWLSGSRYSGRWREMVHRSGLTLKLLTYAPTGAIVAAPTTSLPEILGGARNWDYRYTWMRDAAFTVYALGLAGEEATFSLCSFWWVEALARAGRLDEARLAFEKMLTCANHLGLYSEEIGPTGEQLRNFPQAFTHLALISAAYNLDRELG
jgi:GH15 family glucan-1,4-alpha-glucosidase